MRDATAERNMPRYIGRADTERLQSNDRVRINKSAGDSPACEIEQRKFYENDAGEK